MMKLKPLTELSNKGYQVLLIIATLLILAFFVVFLWFRTGSQLAGGEESFSVFNNRNLLEIDSVWQEVGTGFPNPAYLPRIPVDFFVLLFRNLKIPLWIIQAIFFYLLIVSGLIGVVFLFILLFPRKKNTPFLVLFSLVFYFLNLYTQSQIFGRFLYTAIYIWSYLPIFLYLWIKWTSEPRLKWLFYFLLSNLVFSLVFSHPANILTLWFVAGIWLVFLFLKQIGNFEKVLMVILSSSIGIFFWLIINSWWVYPYLKISKTSFESFDNIQANFNSLQGVSKFFPTYQIILLRQGFLLGDVYFKTEHVSFPLPYNGWYNQFSVWMISVPILLFVVLGIIVSRKNENWNFLIGLLLVGWFVSKGTNWPLGTKFFSLAFKNFPLVQTLRNPYEKFGVVFLLPYSIFFVLGLSWSYEKIRPKFREIVLGLILFFSCGILVWPMWTGTVFGGNVLNAKIRVPEYYEDANQFLNEDKTDGRILILPIISGDGVRYNWKEGYYQGIEPSVFLFDRPSISRYLNTKFFGNKYIELYNAFVNEGDYSRFLDEMDIRYLVLHDDLDEKVSGASSSAQVKESLEKNKDVKFLRRFGELEIYEFKGNEDGSLFEVAGEDAPEITYQKFDTTYYKIFVKNAKKPFNLIFESTFNEFWEARIEKEKIKEHFLVYNYANGWKINKTGSYEVDLIFKVWPWE